MDLRTPKSSFWGCKYIFEKSRISSCCQNRFFLYLSLAFAHKHFAARIFDRPVRLKFESVLFELHIKVANVFSWRKNEKIWESRESRLWRTRKTTWSGTRKNMTPSNPGNDTATTLTIYQLTISSIIFCFDFGWNETSSIWVLNCRTVMTWQGAESGSRKRRKSSRNSRQSRHHHHHHWHPKKERDEEKDSENRSHSLSHPSVCLFRLLQNNLASNGRIYFECRQRRRRKKIFSDASYASDAEKTFP